MPYSARKAASSNTSANLVRFSRSYSALVVRHHRGGSGAREGLGLQFYLAHAGVVFVVRMRRCCSNAARAPTPTGQVKDGQHGVNGVHVAGQRGDFPPLSRAEKNSLVAGDVGHRSQARGGYCV